MTGRQRHFGSKFGSGERGSTLVLVALFIFVLFGFAGLSIDVANVYREKHRAHVATDAAALAGVAKLGDPSVPTATQANDAITEADVIANTNGVTDTEIAAAPTNTCAGCTAQIQVGQWYGGAFSPGATPYNAVRVPAQRTVPLNFSKVGGPLGLSAMKAPLDSIAVIGAMAVPYGIPNCYLGPVGSTNTVQNWGKVACSSSSGNWGPIDLCGSINGSKNVEGALSGPGCFASVGQTTGTSTGFDGVEAGFDDLCGQTIVLPVTDDFPNGSSGDVTIQDFVVVKVLCPKTGSGSNWQMPVVILGRGLSAIRQFGLGPTRSLVE